MCMCELENRLAYHRVNSSRGIGSVHQLRNSVRSTQGTARLRPCSSLGYSGNRRGFGEEKTTELKRIHEDLAKKKGEARALQQQIESLRSELEGYLKDGTPRADEADLRAQLEAAQEQRKRYVNTLRGACD